MADTAQADYIFVLRAVSAVVCTHAGRELVVTHRQESVVVRPTIPHITVLVTPAAFVPPDTTPFQVTINGSGVVIDGVPVTITPHTHTVTINGGPLTINGELVTITQ